MSDVIPGPDDRDLLPVTGEPPNCILDPDGVHVWWFHDCDAGVKYGMKANRNPVMLPTGGEHGWTLVEASPLHVEPSIFCMPPEGCGTHGFFRHGEWIPA